MVNIEPYGGVTTDFISGDRSSVVNRIESVNMLPPGLMLSADYVPGTKLWSMYGEADSLGGPVVCSPASSQGTYIFPIPANKQLFLISSSASDDVGSTGIETVGIYYIDSDGDEQYKTVDLNGASQVEAFAAADNVTKINKIIATSVGTGAVAAGNIQLSDSGQSELYEWIPAGGTQSLTARYWVPKGYVAFVTGVTCRSETGSDGYITFDLERTNSSGVNVIEPSIYCAIPDKWDEIMRELKPAYYAAGGLAGYAAVMVTSGGTNDGVCTASLHVAVVKTPPDLKTYR